MSDSATRIAAIYNVKANTRLVLATDLVARNAECEALRAEVSALRPVNFAKCIERDLAEIARIKLMPGYGHTSQVGDRHQDRIDNLNARIEMWRAKIAASKAPAAPRVVRRDFAAERKARMAHNRAMTAAYFAAFPGERSVTPYQLEQFAAH